jgi:hypothetical protein
VIPEQRPIDRSQPDRGSPDGQTARRTISLLIALAVLGVPAVVLRVLCVGRACTEPASVASTVPFCSLPDRLRTLVGNGFREGRSPDVLGVTKETRVVGGTGIAHGPQTPWPSTSTIDARVPIVFSGIHVSADVLPDGTGLDDVAPTLAELLGYERPHPEVRSGHSVGELDDPVDRPRLLLIVVWKGIGTSDLQARGSQWPYLEFLRSVGPNTFTGSAGSLPLDPAATLTTIGTGGLPYQHGITSRAVLNDEGELVRAWGKDAPVSVIASLADDWDDATDQEARVGLVATDETDRGVIGGDWYVDSDTDRVSIVDQSRVLDTALAELERGYGKDDVADIVAIVDEGPISRMDSNLQRIVDAARRASDDRLSVVVTATGSTATPGNAVPASDVTEDVEDAIPGEDGVVLSAAPGGLYLDQETLAAEKIPDDEVIAALEEVRSDGGTQLFDQVFPALAVSFARYC